jgi:glycosyltransferase involved in cell wall biosynthesis
MDDVRLKWGLRVLYFSEGITIHDLRFLKLLRDHDCMVWFLTLYRPSQWEEPTSVPDGICRLEPVARERRLTSRSALRDYVPRLTTVLREVQPDIVQAGPIQTCSYLIAETGYRPLVSVSWGSDMLVDAARSEESKMITQRALSASDVLVCDSDAVRRAFGQYVNMAPDRIVQFPWGIDLDRLSPGVPGKNIRQELGWAGAQIAFSNRTWAEVYGIDVVLDAFAIAQTHLPNLRLVLAGDGPLAGQIRAKIEGQGLRAQVHCPGRIGQEEMPAWLTASDLYLSCSRMDGSSVSLMEAMACGLPVVATDAGGNREWIENGVNGWLAPVDDAPAFAAAIVSAAEQSADDRKRMSRRNRLVAEERANWVRNSQQLVTALRSLDGMKESGRRYV